MSVVTVFHVTVANHVVSVAPGYVSGSLMVGGESSRKGEIPEVFGQQ